MLDLLLGGAVVIGRRDEGRSTVDLDDHDRLDAIRLDPAFASVEVPTSVEGRAVTVDLGGTSESVTLAADGIDDVDLHRGVPRLDVGHGLGRVEVREDEMGVVPHRRGPLGGEVRGAVRAHGGDVPQTLFTHDTLHLVVEHRAKRASRVASRQLREQCESCAPGGAPVEQTVTVASTRRRHSLVDRLRWAFRIANRVESAQLRYLGTSGMALLTRRSILLLETTGRRSGRPRRTPVAYWETPEGDVIVGGGAAGMTRVDWVANLRARPRAWVWRRRRRIPVMVRELAGEEYARVREEGFDRWPNAPRYERRSGRRIPYFRLTPLPEEPPAERGDPGAPSP